MALIGAYTGVLVPGDALTGTKPLIFDRRWPKVPAAFATGTDATHQYRLQKQLVPLARTFSLFSSSAYSRNFLDITTLANLFYYQI